MRIMTRMGKGALDEMGEDGFFVPCVHTLGAPLAAGQKDVAWPCNDEKWIVHFPETREIWSYGSGYGGNALLGKKCFALRIASVMARDEGWLAEHMLILKLTIPEGAAKYVAAAFPSRLRQDQSRHAAADHSRLEGRDHRRRHRLDALRRRWAPLRHQPGSGLLRRRARHQPEDQQERARHAARQHVVFTNVALTADGDVWWEGLTDTPPPGLTDWQGNPWMADSKFPAAHPNCTLRRARRRSAR